MSASQQDRAGLAATDQDRANAGAQPPASVGMDASAPQPTATTRPGEQATAEATFLDSAKQGPAPAFRAPFVWLRPVVLGLLALLLAYPAPYLERTRSPNALTRIYLTRALVDQRSVRVDAQVQRYGHLLDLAQRDGHYYCDKAPGLSLAAVPIYAALRLVAAAERIDNRLLLRLACLLLLVLPTVLVSHLLWRRLERLGLPPPACALLVAGWGVGSVAYPHSLVFYGHQAAALLLLAACLWLTDPDRPRPLWAGLAAGAAVLTEYPALVPAAGMALWAVLDGAHLGWRSRLRRLARLVLGAVLPAALGGLYHWSAFGAPWRTGYSFIESPSFAAIHRQGLLGVSLPTAEALMGSLLSSSRGIVYLSPWLALGLLGLLWLLARRRREAASQPLLLAWCALSTLWIGTGYGYWMGGWSLGQRHLVSSVPFLVLLAAPLVAWLWRGAAGRVLVAGLIATSILMVTLAGSMLPGYPEEFASPVFQAAWPLWRGGWYPHNPLSSLGGQGSWTMLPLLGGLALLLALLTAASAADGPEPESGATDATRAGGHLPAWRASLPRARIVLTAMAITGLALGWLATAERLTPPLKAFGSFRLAWLGQRMWEPARSPDPRLRWLLDAEGAEARLRKNGWSASLWRSHGVWLALDGQELPAVQAHARGLLPIGWAAPTRPARRPGQTAPLRRQ